MRLLTPETMRALEEANIRSGAVSGAELMERAGRGVIRAAAEWRPLLARPAHAVVLCGPGNNGGDGFVIARLLKEAGWEITLFSWGDTERLPPDAALNCRRWREMGPVHDWDADAVIRAASGAGRRLIIEALFGIGLNRALPDDISALTGAVAALARRDEDQQLSPSIIAVDAPCGLNTDTGQPAGGGAVLAADLTVTFHSEKPGHRLGAGPGFCGRVHVCEIGLEEDLISNDDVNRFSLFDPASPAMGEAARKSGGHKYAHGHVLVLAGGAGKGGAARLAARAALRMGAGLVTLGLCDGPVLAPDEVMQASTPDEAALSAVLADTRINALVIGPGLGVATLTRSLAKSALKGAPPGRRFVLDADALTVFADDPAQLFALTGGAEVLLTPHMGEFRRLFPDLVQYLSDGSSKLEVTAAAARRAGCPVLLKGADTVVASPEGRAAIISAHYGRECPWLATAGAGDVLAGMAAGLMARGFSPDKAGELAAFLHQELARRFGPGLIAGDLVETLPKVLAGLFPGPGEDAL